MSAKGRKAIVVLVLASLCLSLSGGCEGLKYHDIYLAAAGGAVLGAIIGHQSDECGAGAGVGAAVFAAGELLHQIDNLPEKKLEDAAAEVSRNGSSLDPNRVD